MRRRHPFKEAAVGKHILITGGAGFIGSHLADELLRKGHRVRALDNLSRQVHGSARERPEYLDPEVELVIGDVRDRDAVARALSGVDAVFHFAAAVGVGQSMYELDMYADVNTRGTAVLLEELIKRPVERLIVASSMSVYGEGLYSRPDGSIDERAARSVEGLKRGEWEALDRDGGRLTPVPTPESKTPSLTSVYALTKYDQETVCLMTGKAYSIPTVALRFFNAYGERQSASNPYTGVLAIFASRLLNGKAPLIYEDGLQMRDFVGVKDVARACVLALESPSAPGNAVNVGSGRRYAVLEVAGLMSRVFGTEITPEVTGKCRVGDIRHCFADITLAKKVLGYEPEVTLEEGVRELRLWLDGRAVFDRSAEASAELSYRGLTL